MFAVLIVLICVVVILVLFWLAGARAAVSPPRAAVIVSPADLLLPYRNIVFNSKEGFKLFGWLIEQPSPKAILILCHGYPMNRCNMFGLSMRMYRAGYSVLMFDFRAHGESEGKRTTVGFYEADDIICAVDFIKSDKSLADLPIGVIGESMGGAASIMATAKDERIAAVATDSAFAELGSAARVWLSYGVPKGLGWITLPVILFGGWMSKVPFTKVKPSAEIGKISPRAVLITHGDKDKFIPMHHAEQLYKNANEPKELKLFEGCSHVEARLNCADDFEKTILVFFDKYLNREREAPAEQISEGNS